MPDHPDTSFQKAQKKAINKAISDAVKKAFAEDVNLPHMPKKGVPGKGPPIRRVRIKVEQADHFTVPVHSKAVMLKGDNHHVTLQGTRR